MPGNLQFRGYIPNFIHVHIDVFLQSLQIAKVRALNNSGELKRDLACGACRVRYRSMTFDVSSRYRGRAEEERLNAEIGRRGKKRLERSSLPARVVISHESACIATEDGEEGHDLHIYSTRKIPVDRRKTS